MDSTTCPNPDRSSNNEEESPNLDLMLAGRIASRMWQVSGFIEHRTEILEGLSKTVSLGDVLVLICVGWLTVPLTRIVFERIHANMKQETESTRKTLHTSSQDSLRSSGGSFDDRPDTEEQDSDSFYRSWTYQISQLASQIARLSCLVYIVDCLIVMVDMANPDIAFDDYDLSLKFTKLVYTVWAALRLMSIKRYLLCAAANRGSKKKSLGKVEVYDRIVDIFIFFSLAVAILDIANIDIGPGLTSLFAFGGVGTLVLSLACQPMAAQLVSGVVVSTSENFYVGDDIKLGDTRGIVDKIGWFYTDLRGECMSWRGLTIHTLL